jgi:hypothetical protein
MGDSQRLRGANLKILDHDEVRWNFFALAPLRSVPTLWVGPRFLLRYGLSKRPVASSDEALRGSSKPGF